MTYRTDAAGYSYGTYCCYQCKSNCLCSSGRYHCPYCKADFCQTCRPYNAMPAPSPYGAPMCQMGHQLQYTTGSQGCSFNYYTCNRCGKNTIPCMDGRWACFTCNFNLCTTCQPPSQYQSPSPYPMPGSNTYPAPNPYPMPAPNPYSAPIPSPYPMPAPNPYSVPVPVPSPYPSPYYQSVCKNGHPLGHRTTAEGYYDGTFTCAVCYQKLPCSSGRFSCKNCNYDICYKCKPS